MPCLAFLPSPIETWVIRHFFFPIPLCKHPNFQPRWSGWGRNIWAGTFHSFLPFLPIVFPIIHIYLCFTFPRPLARFHPWVIRLCVPTQLHFETPLFQALPYPTCYYYYSLCACVPSYHSSLPRCQTGMPLLPGLCPWPPAVRGVGGWVVVVDIVFQAGRQDGTEQDCACTHAILPTHPPPLGVFFFFH